MVTKYKVLKPAHYWEFCDHCDSWMVICGTCGNNCCNGGYGEVMGIDPYTTMACPECPSAYALQACVYKPKTNVKEDSQYSKQELRDIQTSYIIESQNEV